MSPSGVRSGRLALVERSQEERCRVRWSNSGLLAFGMEPLQPLEHYRKHAARSRQCGFPMEQHCQLHRPVRISIGVASALDQLAVSEKALKRCL